MGCGSSARGPVKASPETSVSDPPVVATWATKTADTPNDASNTANSGHNQAWNKGKGEHVILLDADEDDEIEIIYEANPKQQHRDNREPQMPAAANGQEGPEAMEMDSARQPHSPQKPLSKQQQEEAAKLAERRKKFDNQRYQREQSAGAIPYSDAQGVCPPIVNPSPAQVKKTNTKPTVDTIMGLNQAQTGNHNKMPVPEDTFMPGAIFDESDTGQVVAKAPGKKKRHTHDDVESTGFDADDERMMTEILQDFDDV